MHLTSLKPSVVPILCHDSEAVVRVPAGVAVESPIELGLGFSDNQKPITLKIHLLKGSSATVVVRLESKTSLDSLALNIMAVIEEGAQLRLIEFQNLPIETSYVANRNLDVAKKASLETVLIEVGAQTTGGSLIQTTQGAEATLDSNLLYVARGQQKHKLLLNNKFIHKEGKGEAKVRSIALDEGTIDIQGAIQVGTKANGTESHLHLDSLLLSRTASITAIPALEINTNDVKVGHGASVSNLNEENLFYLTSRGLDPDEARKLMVRGFVSEVTDRLNDLPELRDEILPLI